MAGLFLYPNPGILCYRLSSAFYLDGAFLWLDKCHADIKDHGYAVRAIIRDNVLHSISFVSRPCCNSELY